MRQVLIGEEGKRKRKRKRGKGERDGEEKLNAKRKTRKGGVRVKEKGGEGGKARIFK